MTKYILLFLISSSALADCHIVETLVDKHGVTTTQVCDDGSTRTQLRYEDDHIMEMDG